MKYLSLWKDTIREIKHSFGRFISIFLIVAIGVAFFVGVKGCDPVMKHSADQYFDDYNFMDVKVMSTLGVDEKDVDALKEIDEIEGMYPSYSKDVIVTRDHHQSVYKIMSMPSDYQKNPKHYMNRLRLMEGRLPQKENECVIECGNLNDSGVKIGESIIFESGDDEKISESFKRVEYKVVGKIFTPNYLSYEKGSTLIGTGKINCYAFIFEENFNMEYYTELYITLKNVKKYNSYDDAYFDVVEPITDQIESKYETSVNTRYDEIVSDAKKEIADGEKEYQDGLKEFNEKIDDAQKELDDAYKKIVDGEKELKDNEISAKEEFDKQEKLLKDSQKEYDQGYSEYTSGKSEFEKNEPDLKNKKKEIEKGLKQIKDQKTPLQTQIKGLESQLNNPNLDEATKTQLTTQLTQIKAGLQQLNTKEKELNTSLKTINETLTSTKTKLANSKTKLDEAKKEIASGKTKLADAKKKANEEFAKARKDIEEGKKDWEEGKRELAKEKKKGEKELKDALEKIEDAKFKLEDLKDPDCYVLDRHSHYSFMDYGSAADRMNAIAKIFPVFFFLVAALVCLTTMTRMVDEQRQEIGTLKALGYGKTSIASKFLIYAALASILGGIFGAILGLIIFPTVVYNCWGIMYNMPDVKLLPQVPLAILAISLASLVTLLATFSACYKELMEVPSQLMRPKPPKNGKKIILERITFIWKRLNFTQKVTARNIFRYKKRFLMTVIGISGCTALILAGFGVQDSISDVVNLQYNDIYQFDVTLNGSEDVDDYEALVEKVTALKEVKEAMAMSIEPSIYYEDGNEKGIDLYVPHDEKRFKDYFNLHTRIGKEQLTLNNEGVIISEKVAKTLDLDIDDTLEIKNSDERKAKVKIKGICENYVGHVIYMTPHYYEKVFKEEPQENLIYVKMHEVNNQNEDSLGRQLTQLDEITSVTFYSGVAAGFDDTIGSMSIIVVVLTISAGLLAFVVLYNLTNVNISERLREIATIKVLGFSDREVSAYVYRENIVLTLVGAFVGIFIGIYLHQMIMSLAELETVMFGRNIYRMSYVYAIVITIGFSIIVNLFMYRKLQKIQMVESLKSVE